MQSNACIHRRLTVMRRYVGRLRFNVKTAYSSVARKAL